MGGVAVITTGIDMISASIIEEMNLRMPSIGQFSVDVSDEFRDPKESIQVPYIEAGEVAEFNATSNNYNRAAADLKSASVKLEKRPITGFQITQSQLTRFQPAFWTRRGRADARAVGRSMFKTLTDLVTAANFGDEAKAKTTLGTIDRTTAATLRKAAIKRDLDPEGSILALCPDIYSDLLGIYDSNTYGGTEAVRSGVLPRLLGFSSIIEVPSLLSGGFICHPSALCFGARALPIADTTPYQEFRTITDEELGVPMNIVVYTDGPSGGTSYSVESLYGASVGNDKALVRIIQA